MVKPDALVALDIGRCARCEPAAVAAAAAAFTSRDCRRPRLRKSRHLRVACRHAWGRSASPWLGHSKEDSARIAQKRLCTARSFASSRAGSLSEDIEACTCARPRRSSRLSFAGSRERSDANGGEGERRESAHSPNKIGARNFAKTQRWFQKCKHEPQRATRSTDRA